jgi:hypothetical protein
MLRRRGRHDGWLHDLLELRRLEVRLTLPRIASLRQKVTGTEADFRLS